MKKIFTICYSEEEANEVGHFIRGKGYEGVQNDSYRYCKEHISSAFRENTRHHKDYIFVGCTDVKMIVSKDKKSLRRIGLKYIEKKRKFFDLLSVSFEYSH